ncbi:MAG TPA: dihydropteroate synthase [Syntrophorhabdaceae bacterium]|nr:dihydropteroate synthase [Syntrophorhabdaceae bacterium]
METRVVSAKGKEVIISDNLPTVLIGERINPFGKGPIKQGMVTGDMGPIAKMAVEQVRDGADILIISVAAFGVDEGVILPKAAAAVMEVVDVPLCLESRNPAALEATLKLGCGKPIISSVTGEKEHLDALLPLVKKYDTSLEIIASDAAGIPNNAAKRLEILTSIVEQAGQFGIGADRLIADCIAESSAVNSAAALLTVETMHTVKRALSLNLVLGASNVSFGLPERPVINAVFLSLAIQAGLNCAIVNAAKMKPYIMATDLLLGRDARARRYTTYYRKMKSA